MQLVINGVNETIGASNWPRDLEAAKRGEGDFGVPMPNPIMSRSQALVNMNRARALKSEIQWMLDNTHQDPWDSTPMRSIVTILGNTEYAYQVFIAELDKVAVPERPVEENPVPIPDDTETKPGVMDWIKANPIPVAVGAFLVFNFVILPKNKRLLFPVKR